MFVFCLNVIGGTVELSRVYCKIWACFGVSECLFGRKCDFGSGGSRLTQSWSGGVWFCPWCLSFGRPGSSLRGWSDPRLRLLLPGRTFPPREGGGRAGCTPSLSLSLFISLILVVMWCHSWLTNHSQRSLAAPEPVFLVSCRETCHWIFDRKRFQEQERFRVKQRRAQLRVQETIYWWIWNQRKYSQSKLHQTE